MSLPKFLFFCYSQQCFFFCWRSLRDFLWHLFTQTRSYFTQCFFLLLLLSIYPMSIHFLIMFQKFHLSLDLMYMFLCIHLSEFSSANMLSPWYFQHSSINPYLLCIPPCWVDCSLFPAVWNDWCYITVQHSFVCLQRYFPVP